MASTVTLLESGQMNAKASSHTTGAVTMPAGTLIIVDVKSEDTDTTDTTPTASSPSVSFTNEQHQHSTQQENHNCDRFRGVPSSTVTEAITIDYGADDQRNLKYAVYKVTETVTTGTDGADAFVQTVGDNTGAATSLTITLAALSDAANNVVPAMAGIPNDLDISPEAGYTELAEERDAGDGETLMVMYNTGDNDPTFSASSTPWIGIASELDHDAGGAAAAFPFRQYYQGLMAR